MLRTLLMSAFCVALTACGRQTESVTAPVVNEVAFSEAFHYFVKAEADSVPSKVLTAEEFDRYFGATATMGADGKPTPIDFDKEFVIAVTMGPTDTSVDFEVNSLTLDDKTLTLDVSHTRGQPLPYTVQPLLLLTVDRAFADCDVIVQEI